MHFLTREDYYDTLVPRTTPLVFNLRSDPFESYDNKDSFGHLAQRDSWVFQPIVEGLKAHLMTLAKYPPVQGGSSFDMSNAVEDFLRMSKQ